MKKEFFFCFSFALNPGPADAGNQVLQTMENAEASQSALSRIDPGLIELASRVAERRIGKFY